MFWYCSEIYRLNKLGNYDFFLSVLFYRQSRTALGSFNRTMLENPLQKKGIHFTDQELHDIRKLFYELAEIDVEHYFRVQREKALAKSDK